MIPVPFKVSGDQVDSRGIGSRIWASGDAFRAGGQPDGGAEIVGDKVSDHSDSILNTATGSGTPGLPPLPLFAPSAPPPIGKSPTDGLPQTPQSVTAPSSVKGRSVQTVAYSLHGASRTSSASYSGTEQSPLPHTARTFRTPSSRNSRAPWAASPAPVLPG